jgi:hypothetical protein
VIEKDKKGLAELLKKSSDLRSTMSRTDPLASNDDMKMIKDIGVPVSYVRSRYDEVAYSQLQMKH